MNLNELGDDFGAACLFSSILVLWTQLATEPLWVNAVDHKTARCLRLQKCGPPRETGENPWLNCSCKWFWHTLTFNETRTKTNSICFQDSCIQRAAYAPTKCRYIQIFPLFQHFPDSWNILILIHTHFWIFQMPLKFLRSSFNLVVPEMGDKKRSSLEANFRTSSSTLNLQIWWVKAFGYEMCR